MGEKTPSVYFSQLRAMLIRNLLLKKREKRKTTAVSVSRNPLCITACGLPTSALLISIYFAGNPPASLLPRYTNRDENPHPESEFPGPFDAPRRRQSIRTFPAF